MKTVKEILTDHAKANNWGTDDDTLIEIVTEAKEVWRDPNLDRHRWYSFQGVVAEVDGSYIAYTKYIVTGDNSLDDMGLEYDLSEMKVVEKKERTITETYYE